MDNNCRVNIEAIDFLNRLNESGSIAYADYSHLHDLLTSEEPKWEYAQSEVLTDGTVAFGNPVETLEEAIRRRDIDRINYPWPEEIGVGRRRKAGPWVPLEN